MHLNRSLCRPLAVLVAAISFSAHATQESGPSQAALKAGEPYMRALESAASAYASHDFSAALDKLDLADHIQPDIPDTWDMRGAIYAEQHAFEKAQDAFERAARLNPGDFWPRYNIAQLLLMQKKYKEAAAAFQKLEVYAGHQELVQFKIVYADLLQGNTAAAKPVLDAMKFPSSTPAYYFAHAAWGFAQKDGKEGDYWTQAGLKVFGREPCVPYYDALAILGWVPRRLADGSVPERTDLSTLPAATPDALGTPLAAPLATP